MSKNENLFIGSHLVVNFIFVNQIFDLKFLPARIARMVFCNVFNFLENE